MEDGGEIGGSGAHFPSTPVKNLADLRSRENSQQYSSIYDDQRPKIEDIERRVLKDNKVPGTNTGTRAAESTARVQGLLPDSWERARLSCVSSQVLVWTRGA